MALKVAAKTAAKAEAAYPLEIKSTLSPPTFVNGKTAEKSEGVRIVYKRPRSSKSDTFIIPWEHVLAAQIGANGWILTDHPDFVTPLLDIVMDEAEFSPSDIIGTDPKSGDRVIINKKAMTVSARYASYSE